MLPQTNLRQGKTVPGGIDESCSDLLVTLATTLTLKRADVRQVDVSDISNIREVLGQLEAAATTKVHCIIAMLGAGVTDEAYD